DVKAQWLKGDSPGRAVDGVYGLDLKTGGYVEADWLILPEIGIVLRGDLRDARVTLSNERLYLTKSWGATIGAKVVFTKNIAFKGEYLHNGEYGGIPQIKNDIFTTSFLVSY